MQTSKDTNSAAKPLSARAIETMKPGDKPKADTGENSGLRVKCGSGGTKTFIYRYRSPELFDKAGMARLVQVKIGNYPAMKLAEARIELQALKEMRQKGICPNSEQERQKKSLADERQEQQRAGVIECFTVKDLVELYLTGSIEDRMINGKRKLGARKPKGQSETRRTLEGDAVRVLGDVPAAKVTRKIVVDLIMAIVDRGANVQAGNVLRELSAAYEFAIGLEKFDDDFANPALLAKASLRQAKVKLTSTKGKRVLSDKELVEVLKWLPGSGFSVTQKNVIRFTLWTGCRTGEVCQARWEDIELEKGVWHMRDSKNGSERYVQLSLQAVAFLKQLKLSTETYLFPSMRTGLPIQQKSLSETKWQLKNPDKVQNGRRYNMQQVWIDSIADWSPHDLRRTVRTGLSRLGCRKEVAEAVLGHSRKGIEGTYDLYSYEPECKEWLQKWADHLDGLLLWLGKVEART